MTLDSVVEVPLNGSYMTFGIVKNIEVSKTAFPSQKSIISLHTVFYKMPVFLCWLRIGNFMRWSKGNITCERYLSYSWKLGVTQPFKVWRTFKVYDILGFCWKDRNRYLKSKHVRILDRIHVKCCLSASSSDSKGSPQRLHISHHQTMCC